MCKILEDRKFLVWHHLIMKERQGNVNTTTNWKSSTNQSFKQRSDNVKKPLIVRILYGLNFEIL